MSTSRRSGPTRQGVVEDGMGAEDGRRRGSTSSIAPDQVLLLVLCAAIFLDSMSVSLMSIALPAIERGLDLSTESAQWIVSGYTIAFGGLLLLGGRLVDLLGSKTVFLLGMAVLGGGGVVSGLADTGWLLIAGRIVSGVGAALVAPAALTALLQRFTTVERRSAAIRAFSAAGAVGYGAGLVVSGALTSLSWRVTVLLPAAIALLLVGAGAVLVPKAATGAGRTLDVLGSLLVTSALLAGVFVITTVPSAGWNPPTVGALVVSALAATGFVLSERRRVDPLLPRTLRRSSTLLPGNVLALLWAAASIGWQLVAALTLSDRFHFGALTSGLAILPLAVMIALTQLVARRWISRGSPRTVAAVGMAVQGAGILWFVLAVQTGDYWTGALPGILLHGIGNGLVFPTFYSQAVSGVEHQDEGVASALVNTSVQVGSGIGVAVASALIVLSAGFTAAVVGAAVFSASGVVWALLRLRRTAA